VPSATKATVNPAGACTGAEVGAGVTVERTAVGRLCVAAEVGAFGVDVLHATRLTATATVAVR